MRGICGHVLDIFVYLGYDNLFGIDYIYTAVCNNFEPLIYISIYIYGVHCGKVLV